MPDQIFISYRRGDSAYVTGHINDLLRKEFGNEAVFTDVDNIALGVDFRAVLDETVSQCQVLLAVIGADWVGAKDQDGNLRLHDPADFVRIEIESALNRNIPVIPLLVGGARMPLSEELPGTLKGLAFRNGTPIRPAPDFNTDMARLIKYLRTHFDSVRPSDSGISVRKEPELKSQAAAPAPAQKKSAQSGMHVAADDSARKRAELGIESSPTKRRSVGVWVMLLAVIAVGGWYYFDQNPAALQSLMQIANPDRSTIAADELATEQPPAEPADTDSTPPTDLPAVSIDAGETVVLESDSGATVTVVDAGTATQTPMELLNSGANTDLEETVDAALSTLEESAQAVSNDTDEELAQAEADVNDAAADLTETVANTTSTASVGEMVETPDSLRGAGVSGNIRDGVRLAAVGDHEAAIQIFDVAIQRDMDSAFAYKQRAASHRALGDYDAAIADYDQAITLNDEDVNAIYNRGAAHLATENYVAAIADFDNVIALDPEFVEAYSRRADAHEANGNTEAAIRDRAVVTVFESNREERR